MGLLAHGLWWIVPLFLIAGFMVYSMVACTTALLVRRGHRRPIAAAQLASRLSAIADPDGRWHVTDLPDGEFELVFNVVDGSWREGLARIKFDLLYRARMCLDGSALEVRWFEVLRTGSWFLGLVGFRPRFNASFRLQYGYIDAVWRGVAYGMLPGFPPRIGRTQPFELDTIAIKRTVARVVTGAGWTFRPVTLPWQVNGAWMRLTQALTPAWLRRIPRSRTWGVLYVTSFLAFYFYLYGALMDPVTDWNVHNVVIGAGIAAVWWAIWGGVAWLLVRQARPRRERRRARAASTGAKPAVSADARPHGSSSDE